MSIPRLLAARVRQAARGLKPSTRSFRREVRDESLYVRSGGRTTFAGREHFSRDEWKELVREGPLLVPSLLHERSVPDGDRTWLGRLLYREISLAVGNDISTDPGAIRSLTKALVALDNDRADMAEWVRDLFERAHAPLRPSPLVLARRNRQAARLALAETLLGWHGMNEQEAERAIEYRSWGVSPLSLTNTRRALIMECVVGNPVFPAERIADLVTEFGTHALGAVESAADAGRDEVMLALGGSRERRIRLEVYRVAPPEMLRKLLVNRMGSDDYELESLLGIWLTGSAPLDLPEHFARRAVRLFLGRPGKLRELLDALRASSTSDIPADMLPELLVHPDRHVRLAAIQYAGSPAPSPTREAEDGAETPVAAQPSRGRRP